MTNDKVTVECPAADYKLEQMREICHGFSCSVKFNDNKIYFLITGKPQDIFWLGMNLIHRLGLGKPISDMQELQKNNHE